METVREYLENSTAFEDVTFRNGDVIKIHIEVLEKIIEEYSKLRVEDNKESIRGYLRGEDFEMLAEGV
ncbi:hypothetical protein N9924_00220 [bacterium]|nr:hypothetical protein [bacterium]